MQKETNLRVLKRLEVFLCPLVVSFAEGRLVIWAVRCLLLGRLFCDVAR